MKKKKYKDYSWIWLVVAGTMPAIFGLMSSDIKLLGMGTLVTVILFVSWAIFFYPLYLKRKSKVKSSEEKLI